MWSYSELARTDLLSGVPVVAIEAAAAAEARERELLLYREGEPGEALISQFGRDDGGAGGPGAGSG